MKKMTTQVLMQRKKNVVEVDGLTAKVPDNISMISVFGVNSFIDQGDYKEDGWIYVQNKPVRKWFKKLDDITYWHPILDDLHKLKNRLEIIIEGKNETRMV